MYLLGLCCLPPVFITFFSFFFSYRKTFQSFAEMFYFFPGEGGYYRLNQMIDVTARGRWLVHQPVQVRISGAMTHSRNVALVNREYSCKCNWLHKLHPPELRSRQICRLFHPFVKHVPKQIIKQWKACHVLGKREALIVCHSRMFMCTLFCLWTVQRHINTGS